MKTFIDTENRFLYQDGEIWRLGRRVNVPRTDGTYSPGYEILDHYTPELAHVVLADVTGLDYGVVWTKRVLREKLGEL